MGQYQAVGPAGVEERVDEGAHVVLVPAGGSGQRQGVQVVALVGEGGSLGKASGAAGVEDDVQVVFAYFDLRFGR